MGNPMIQVEHCPEIDDARTFEVEFNDTWGNNATLALVEIDMTEALINSGIKLVDYGNV